METIIKPFQLGIASELIRNYNKEKPFAAYFTEQCKLHRNWGSRDRKIYRQACYAYFRLGYVAQNGTIENNILLGLQQSENILSQIEAKEIFPSFELISDAIDKDAYLKSLLEQKPVYLALVEGQEQNVYNALEINGIPFERINKACIQVPTNAKCNDITENGWAWIMDRSSQEAADKIHIKEYDEVWDCCSGAGGKALFLRNKFKNKFKLTCSDARFSILENLKVRFKNSGLKEPHIELSDLNSPFQLNTKYDVIVADVPCSGSGTWGRTPENITGTELHKINYYAGLQRIIFKNALRNLKSGGKIYYITCSVFREENESNLAYFEQNLQLQIINQQYINMAPELTDYLFVAELLKY